MKYKKKKLILTLDIIEQKKEKNQEKSIEKKKMNIIEDSCIVECLQLLDAFAMCYSIFPEKVNKLFTVECK